MSFLIAPHPRTKYKLCFKFCFVVDGIPMDLSLWSNDAYEIVHLYLQSCWIGILDCWRLIKFTKSLWPIVDIIETPNQRLLQRVYNFGPILLISKGQSGCLKLYRK